MRLSEVELQHTSGFPIVRGQLAIDSAGTPSALDVPPHDHLLLVYPRWSAVRPGGMAMWPVLSKKLRGDGFYAVTLAHHGVGIHDLTPADLGSLAAPDGASRSMTRSGWLAGNLIARDAAADSVSAWAARPGTAIQSYEVRAELGPGGLTFAIGGRFDTMPDDSGVSGAAFSVTAAIPWGTMTVKDLPGAGSHWQFGNPQAVSLGRVSTEQRRDPHRLQDLLFASGNCWPAIRGHIVFGDERPSETGGAGFLFWTSNPYAPQATSLWDLSTLELLENGFAGSALLRRSLSLHGLQIGLLEKALDVHNAFSHQVAGDVGGVSRPTGYAMEAGDPLGRITQPVTSATIKAALKKGGLSVVVEGELGDFHSTELARHRAERNSQLVPHRRYAVDFVVPWALLAVRGSTLARRADGFAGWS